MTFQGDPYRTLGIAPGASLNEIKSAYRRLAKQYHPDTAGERALPRFLSIQAAYERLVDGEGRLRHPGRGERARGTSAGAGANPAGDEPWRADPARARASRDAWRARRSAGGAGASARGSGSASATGGAPGAAGPPGARPGTGAGTGAGSAGPAPPGADGGGRGRSGAAAPGRGDRQARRGPRKATPGSTTYDEALETPRDPEWDGGAWYGPTSGTFWTLNPREYADPRKHGPEYLARARRAAMTGEPDLAIPEPGAETGATVDPDRWRWSAPGRTTTAGSDAEWGTGAWTYDPGGTPGVAGATWTAGATGRRGPRPVAADTRMDAPPLPDLEALARRAGPRSLLALARRPALRWRLLVALIAWPPLGYAVGTVLASVTGCATFSAACGGVDPLLPLAVQPLVVAALALLPPAAAAGAFASLVALAVAVPVAAVLAVGSMPEQRAGAGVLGLLATAAYLVALAAGVLAVWRDDRGSDDRAP